MNQSDASRRTNSKKDQLYERHLDDRENHKQIQKKNTKDSKKTDWNENESKIDKMWIWKGKDYFFRISHQLSQDIFNHWQINNC